MKQNKSTTMIVFLLSFIIFFAIAIWGKWFLKSGDEMGFVLLNFYVIMPLVSLASGFYLGLKGSDLKFLYPLVFGILGVLIPIFIMPNSWDWFSVLFSLVPAIVGLLMGSALFNRTKPLVA